MYMQLLSGAGKEDEVGKMTTKSSQITQAGIQLRWNQGESVSLEITNQVQNKEDQRRPEGMKEDHRGP